MWRLGGGLGRGGGGGGGYDFHKEENKLQKN